MEICGPDGAETCNPHSLAPYDASPGESEVMDAMSKMRILLVVASVVAFTAIVVGVLAWAGIENSGSGYYHK
jgi:hypothetical protein